MRWYEIKIKFSESGDRRNWPSENYNFIRFKLFQIVDNLNLNKFLIFNYFEPGVRDYIRFRIEANQEKLTKVRGILDEMKHEKVIFDYTCEEWSATNDAKLRIALARDKIGEMFNTKIPTNWKIAGKKDNAWVIAPEDCTKKVQQFTIMMEEVIGQCTRIFMEKLKEKPDDRWLMSLFVHLLLNSLCCSLNEENEVRIFPAV